jgi:multidrug efflux pump subunit AcrA (membrane-fusion protein)
MAGKASPIMTKARKIGLCVAGLVVAIGVAAASGVDLRPATAAKSDDPRQTPPLVTTAVVKPAFPAERTFTGVVSARVQSNLGFRVPGKVIERLVDVGQNVRAGQVLMRLDRKDLDLTLTARENAVTSARALARQAAADEARYRQLLAEGWSTSQKYEQIKALLDSANAQLAAAEAQAEVAKNEAGYSLLVADADGTVVDTLVEPGQVVAAGQPVVSLAHSGPREATDSTPGARLCCTSDCVRHIVQCFIGAPAANFRCRRPRQPNLRSALCAGR